MSEEFFFSLDFKLPYYMRIMPFVFDRCKASRYFSIQADEPPYTERNSWYARAALNECKSALDLIQVDMRTMGLLSDWKKSTEKEQLQDNVVIKMITCCRNLSFHTGSVALKEQERLVRLIGPDESRLHNFKTLFIDGLSENSIDKRVNLETHELETMTEIADGIPLFMILAECYKQMDISLENFLIDHGKLDLDTHKQFWDRAD